MSLNDFLINCLNLVAYNSSLFPNLNLNSFSFQGLAGSVNYSPLDFIDLWPGEYSESVDDSEC